MSADDDFLDQIQACSTPVYLSQKAEIIDYYHDRYGDDWKSELVGGLGEITGLKRSSLMRRFQGGREYSTRVTPKAQEEYELLGQNIGPIRYEPPAGGYRITFVGDIRISKKCYPRHFTCVITGADAQEFASALSGEDSDEGVSIDDLWEAIFYEYFEDDTAEGYCGEPSITVDPL